MKSMGTYNLFLKLLFVSLLFTACSKEELKNSKIVSEPQIFSISTENELFKKPADNSIRTNCIMPYFADGNLENTCPVTEFGLVLNDYFSELTKDPVFDLALLEYYKMLNTKYATYYEGPNYYGEQGQYDQLAKKRVRELNNFWNLDRKIYLNAQHNAWLNDREKLAAMIESFDNSIRNRNEAYEKADELISLNNRSINFPENPTFAFDAFTKSNGLLVIGDGILKVLVESGIDGNIAFTAIVAHEWWHQAQFEYADQWTYKDGLSSISEISRYQELEADFAAAYYMTHKRGATYNWKRIEDYFQLSFSVGDCAVNSLQHHGTPAQRLAAAKAGYNLANSAQKKGKILEPESIHRYFLKYYTEIISE